MIAASVGLSAGPAFSQIDWLSIHLDTQRAANLLQHQQRMSTPSPDAQAEESATSIPPRVIERSFVVYVLRPDGTPDVREGNVVPHLPREGCWVWSARLDAGEVEFVETLTLPEPAGVWEGHSSTVYSDDGRSATNYLSLVPDDGWIGNAWCVGDGDPTGYHTIIVTIGDVEVAKFEFAVENVK